ncbi:MAG: hypothetical protein ACE5KM_17335 [Planctomycetaceae bacterium]
MVQQVTVRCFAGLAVVMAASTGIADESQPPVRRKSFAALQAEVRSLKVEKVAWRKIPWKTCLLDGLKASRKQKKPLVLWIFIDRPIDDERC